MVNGIVNSILSILLTTILAESRTYVGCCWRALIAQKGTLKVLCEILIEDAKL